MSVWLTADVGRFITLSVKFLMVGYILFTAHSPDTIYMTEEFRQKSDERVHGEKGLIFAVLLAVTKYFQRVLGQLNSQRLVLDSHLSKRIHNKDLQELSRVKKSLVYLSSSIRTNLMMLESLKDRESGLHMDTSEEEMCDDVIIEVQRSSQMIKIYSGVTEGISKTSNNILSNNLNNTIQFLTVWSLLLTIPTIVTGFFGMSVDLPIFHNPFDWAIATVGSAIVMAILLWYLRWHNML